VAKRVQAQPLSAFRFHPSHDARTARDEVADVVTIWCRVNVVPSMKAWRDCPQLLAQKGPWFSPLQRTSPVDRQREQQAS
jgi:hypothetical protein